MTSSDSSLHKELQSSQISKSEEDVQKAMQAFNNFTNPFAVDIADEVFCLSSGKPAPVEIKYDLLKAEVYGR